MGYQIPAINIEPLNQNDLVKYAKASGDFNPIHLDKEFAKTMGFDNVIAHGMLIMAYLGRTLTENIEQNNIFPNQFNFKKLRMIISTGSPLVNERLRNNSEHIFFYPHSEDGRNSY